MPRDERRHGLPGIEDLTKEQDGVLALPAKGRHLVVGGPGTGKTVVCLLRARRHAAKSEDYEFLVWNHLLHRASRAMFDGELQAETWVRWFWREFRKVVGESVPTVASTGGGWQPIDWEGVERAIQALPESGNEEAGFPSLVIDEGQDMPPAFYDSLLALGFADIFVAADQNQQIREHENSSISELADCLVLEAGDVTRLTYNHRNTYPIARLAREFHTGDPASPPPALPPQRGRTVYRPRLYYVNGDVLSRIGRSIVRHWDQDPRRLIGVIAPSNEVRERYLRAVTESSSRVPLDNGRPRIETFHRCHRPDVQVDRGGILVVNAQACKGLEFDTVVLADIEEHRVDAADPDRARKLFYVMVSRARGRVVMFMKRNANRELEEILPKDDAILHREDLPA